MHALEPPAGGRRKPDRRNHRGQAPPVQRYWRTSERRAIAQLPSCSPASALYNAVALLIPTAPAPRRSGIRRWAVRPSCNAMPTRQAQPDRRGPAPTVVQDNIKITSPKDAIALLGLPPSRSHPGALANPSFLLSLAANTRAHRQHDLRNWSRSPEDVEATLPEGESCRGR